MTRFEQVGVRIQSESRSIQHAKHSFENSCNICCCRGLRIECDTCAIRAAHEQVVACIIDAGIVLREREAYTRQLLRSRL